MIINSIISKSYGNDRKTVWIRELIAEETIKKFNFLFKTELNEMTKCKLGEHRINTKSLPIVQKNIPIQKLWEREIDEEINKLLKCGIITPSKSPWASSIIPIRNKTGEL
jgi:hypothetical protein